MTDRPRPLGFGYADTDDNALHALGAFAERPVIVVSYSGDDGGFWTAEFAVRSEESLARWVTGTSPMEAVQALWDTAAFQGLNHWAEAPE